MFLKLEGSWLYSTRLLKLKRLGVREPLLMIMRAWQYALNECRDTAPVMTTEAIDMMEDTIGWDGAEGDLVEAFRSTGVLDGDTFALWWDDGAGSLVESRRRDRERKRRQRTPPKVVKKSTQPELNVSEPYESYPQGDSPPQGRTVAVVPPESVNVPRDNPGTASQTRLDQTRLDYIATSASAADAPRVVADWRAEVAGLMGTDAPAVIAIVERVAAGRSICGDDPYTVWMSAKVPIKAAGSRVHFSFALAEFAKKLDDGSAKTYSSAPWSWIAATAGNGPMGSNQQRKAPVGTMHETNRRQAAGEYGPPVDLPPGEGSDVGVSTW